MRPFFIQGPVTVGGGGGGTVVIDADGSVLAQGAHATPIDYTGLTVGAGANRALVCCILTDATAAVTAFTLTWDKGGTNQAMAAITGAAGNDAGNNVRAMWFGLVAPTSGNKTLEIAWAGGASIEMYVCASSVTGADQTGGTTTFANGATAHGTTSPASIAITSATGHMAFAAGVFDSLTATPGSTSIFNNNTLNDIGAANRAAGASTVTLSTTMTSPVDWVLSGFDLKAA